MDILLEEDNGREAACSAKTRREFGPLECRLNSTPRAYKAVTIRTVYNDRERSRIASYATTASLPSMWKIKTIQIRRKITHFSSVPRGETVLLSVLVPYLSSLAPCPLLLKPTQGRVVASTRTSTIPQIRSDRTQGRRWSVPEGTLDGHKR